MNDYQKQRFSELIVISVLLSQPACFFSFHPSPDSSSLRLAKKEKDKEESEKNS